MNKKEILERLQELDRLLKLSQEDYIAEHDKMFPNYPLDPDGYCPHLLGWIEAEIEYILKGGE